MDHEDTSSAKAGSKRTYSAGWVGVVVGPVFLLLAFWFVKGPDLARIPSAMGDTVDTSVLTTTPLRTILGDPPTIKLAGYEYTCMDCHRLFPVSEKPPEELMQHTHIVMNHGINSACRNCHYPADRDRLAVRGGSIPYADVARLCEQCHGPTYRDWEHGAHGRTNGHWDASRGELRRLNCTECHEPHSPRYPAMNPLTPLPAPVTLRMGPLREHSEAVLEDETDPLRRVLYGSGGSEGSGQEDH